MQTKLIKLTQTFNEFEKHFEHFFGECERGFTNELIIQMFCRLFTHGKTVISYKSTVKDLYFIRQGIVEVFNNENDEMIKDLAVLYLPTHSYFGDYQILKNLKSNITIKTLSLKKQYGENVNEQNIVPQETIFMCVEKTQFMELCELFPQTKENLIRKSAERRMKFMKQRNLNSKTYWKERGKTKWNLDNDGNVKKVKVYDGHSDPNDTLDKVIHNMVITGEKKINDFVCEGYPYNEHIRNDKDY